MLQRTTPPPSRYVHVQPYRNVSSFTLLHPPNFLALLCDTENFADGNDGRSSSANLPATTGAQVSFNRVVPFQTTPRTGSDMTYKKTNKVEHAKQCPKCLECFHLFENSRRYCRTLAVRPPSQSKLSRDQVY